MTIAARARAGLRLAAILLSALWLLSAAAAAGRERDFYPEISRFDGDMELGFSRETFEHKINGRGSSTEDNTAIERLRLGALGYIYHPRFITFKVKGAWGLQQEIFDGGTSDTVRTSRTTEEYDLRAWFLPEHDYNLEVYASRRNPLLLGRLAPGANTVTYDKGAIARYLRRPWALEAGASDSSTTGRNTVAYDTRSKYASASSFHGPMTTTLSYSHIFTSQQAEENQNERSRYYFSNQISLPRLSLSSRVEHYDEEQRGIFTPVSTSERGNWSEDLNVQLPAGFRAGGFYSVYKDTRKTLPGLHSEPEQSFARAETSRFTAGHNLYASLKTNYSLQYTTIDSTTGDSESEFETISTLYSKVVPGGRMVLGGSIGRTEQDRNGAPVVLREQHDLSVPGSLLLNEDRVDVSTVSVRVQDPSGFLVLLDPIYYSVVQSGPRYEIFIVNLPPPFLLGSSYPFQVDYAMIPSDVEISTRQTGYNISFQLLDGRLNPYYVHTSSEQTVTSGSIVGGPDSMTSDTVGIQVSAAPVTLLGEYTNYRSRTSPFESWRAGADVKGQLSASASATARLFHSRTRYYESPVRVDEYADELTETSFQLLKYIPEKRLNVSAGGSYTLRRSFATTQSYSANAVLLWRIGSLETRAGVSSTYSSSTFAAGSQRSATNYYYITLTRNLF